MSGPKYSEWQVLENARLRAAQRAAALAEIAAHESDIDGVAAKLRDERPDLAAGLEGLRSSSGDRPGPSASIEELTDYARRLREVAAAGRSRFAAAEACRQVEAEMAAAAAAIRAGRARQSAERDRQEAVRRDSQQSLAARLLRRMPEGATEGEAKCLASIASALTNAPAATAGLIEAEMRTELQRVRGSTERRAREAAETAALRPLLWGFTEPEAAALLDRLTRVENGEERLDARLSEKVRAAAERLRREADRRYAAQVLHEELAALGYVVGEQFGAAMLAGGEAVVAHAKNPGYAVQFAFDPAAGGLNSELVAVGVPDGLSSAERARRDASAERYWCLFFANLVAAADQRYVRGRLR